MAIPSSYPDWALTPPAQASANEQQTLTFYGTPAQGGFYIGISGTNTALINWNDSNANIQTKINAVYAPGTAVVSGSMAAGLVIDFGTFSQTNFIALVIVTQGVSPLLTSALVAVTVIPSLSQSTNFAAVIPVDTNHTNNGWSFLEKPAFNLLNQWMNLVGLWIRWFAPKVGNAPIFWGGTENGTVNAFALASVANFPANASILNGTVINFMASTLNTGPATLAVNGQATISILDVNGYPLQSIMIRANSFVSLMYNGTNWIFITPKNTKRQWSVVGDPSVTASPSFAITGFDRSSWTVTDTGGFLNNTQYAAIGVPAVNLLTDTINTHTATFAPTNNRFVINANMGLLIHGLNLLNNQASQGFIGYATGTPILNASDPLANLTGWGLWFKWHSGTTVDIYFVNNNNSASSVITLLEPVISGGGEYFAQIDFTNNIFTITYVYVATGSVVSASVNTQIPTVGNTTLTIKPFIRVSNNSAGGGESVLPIAEIYGDYGDGN